MGKKFNNNGNKRFSWFDQKIKQKGPNFLGEMNPYEISRDTRNIFKDIIYGNINYMEQAHYFTDLNLAYTLETNAYANYKYHNDTYSGLIAKYSNADPTGLDETALQNQQHIVNFHFNAAYAYSLLTESMYNIENIIKSGNDNQLTMIVDVLVTVSQKLSLPQYKQIFNNICPYIVISN